MESTLREYNSLRKFVANTCCICAALLMTDDDRHHQPLLVCPPTLRVGGPLIRN